MLTPKHIIGTCHIYVLFGRLFRPSGWYANLTLVNIAQFSSTFVSQNFSFFVKAFWLSLSTKLLYYFVKSTNNIEFNFGFIKSYIICFITPRDWG